MVNFAYILAGGRSKRMGQDKLLLLHNNHTLISRVLVSCIDQFETVKLVAKETPEYDSCGAGTIIDRPEAKGPMAGVMAALLDCPEEICFITAADLYDLNRETISLLCQSYAGEQYLGISEDGLSQPLCGIYHRSALAVIKNLAAANHYSMRGAVDRLRHRLIAPPVSIWRNINTPEDFASLRTDNV